LLLLVAVVVDGLMVVVVVEQEDFVQELYQFLSQLIQLLLDREELVELQVEQDPRELRLHLA
jgi:hypothetical protein